MFHVVRNWPHCARFRRRRPVLGRLEEPLRHVRQVLLVVDPQDQVVAEDDLSHGGPQKSVSSFSSSVDCSGNLNGPLTMSPCWIRRKKSPGSFPWFYKHNNIFFYSSCSADSSPGALAFVRKLDSCFVRIFKNFFFSISAVCLRNNGSMAQWSSHPPQDQNGFQSRQSIIFSANIAEAIPMTLFIIKIFCIFAWFFLLLKLLFLFCYLSLDRKHISIHICPFGRKSYICIYICICTHMCAI
jgi:hypothetical protein